MCKAMRYDPARGLFPRGFAGATGRLDEIDLVLVVAEPGEPSATSVRSPEGQPEDVIEFMAWAVGGAFRDRDSAFHRNVRYLLDCCWGETTFDECMRRTWITEGVLCSAARTAGPVAKSVVRECVSRYLAPQLALLPNAFVIALGGKAASRIRLAGRAPDAKAFAAGLPGANSKRARPSWRDAGAAFQAHLRARHPGAAS
jgi:hypothetical protein